MTCVHHWLIESPNGAMVAARCKHCGAERTYSTAGDSEDRDFNLKGSSEWRRK